MTVLALRLANVGQRRQQAARQRLAQDVEEHLAGAARRRGADHLDHQRRPHPQLGVARHDRSSTTATSGVQWDGPADRPQRLEARRAASPTPSCGGRTSGAANGWWPSPAAGCKQQLEAPRRAAGRDRPRRRGARSRGADHRLRPPLRHLQARHAALPQPRTAGGDHQQQGPAGADRLRRQGPSARTTAARS